MFKDWLERTKELQVEYFGLDLEELRLNPEARADYLMANIAAAHDEISEFSHEVGWKPWMKNRGGVNFDTSLEELVDVLHFIANLLIAIGASDEQVEKVYETKMQVNRERMEAKRAYSD